MRQKFILYKIIAILLLLNFSTYTLYVIGGKSLTKLSANTPIEEKQQTPEEDDSIESIGIHFLASTKLSIVSAADFIVSKAKFYHAHQPITSVQWLECFFTPPDIA
jgi:hypothetical protein